MKPTITDRYRSWRYHRALRREARRRRRRHAHTWATTTPTITGWSIRRCTTCGEEKLS